MDGPGHYDPDSDAYRYLNFSEPAPLPFILSSAAVPGDGLNLDGQPVDPLPFALPVAHDNELNLDGLQPAEPLSFSLPDAPNIALNPDGHPEELSPLEAPDHNGFDPEGLLQEPMPHAVSLPVPDEGIDPDGFIAGDPSLELLVDRLTLNGPRNPVVSTAPLSGYELIRSMVERFLAAGGSSQSDAAMVPVVVSLHAGDLDCGWCFVLREIVHCNGHLTVRFSLHGWVGTFNHAIFVIDNSHAGIVEQCYIDLSARDYDWVKRFLTQYATALNAEGSLVLDDSLASFCSALCAGMDSTMLHSTSESSPADPNSGSSLLGITQVNDGSSGAASQTSSQEEEEKGGPSRVEDLPTAAGGAGGPIRRNQKRANNSIAAQRERTGNMSLKDVVSYFHLPLSEAAKRLDMCTTALKHICRRNGIPRWPSRKVKSLDRQIASLERELKRRNGAGASGLQMEIDSLRAQRARVCGGNSTPD